MGYKFFNEFSLNSIVLQRAKGDYSKLDLSSENFDLFIWINL